MERGSKLKCSKISPKHYRLQYLLPKLSRYIRKDRSQNENFQSSVVFVCCRIILVHRGLMFLKTQNSHMNHPPKIFPQGHLPQRIRFDWFQLSTNTIQNPEMKHHNKMMLYKGMPEVAPSRYLRNHCFHVLSNKLTMASSI